MFLHLGADCRTNTKTRLRQRQRQRQRQDKDKDKGKDKDKTKTKTNTKRLNTFFLQLGAECRRGRRPPLWKFGSAPSLKVANKKGSFSSSLTCLLHSCLNILQKNLFSCETQSSLSSLAPCQTLPRYQKCVDTFFWLKQSVFN